MTSSNDARPTRNDEPAEDTAMYDLVILSAAIGLIPLALGLGIDLAEGLVRRLGAALRAG